MVFKNSVRISAAILLLFVGLQFQAPRPSKQEVRGSGTGPRGPQHVGTQAIVPSSGQPQSAAGKGNATRPHHRNKRSGVAAAALGKTSSGSAVLAIPPAVGSAASAAPSSSAQKSAPAASSASSPSTPSTPANPQASSQASSGAAQGGDDSDAGDDSA